MVRGYQLDMNPKASVVTEYFAVVHLRHLKRTRCSQSDVRIVRSKADAIKKSNRKKMLYAARVIGPARSSEGFNLFYIVELYQD